MKVVHTIVEEHWAVLIETRDELADVQAALWHHDHIDAHHGGRGARSPEECGACRLVEQLKSSL